MARIACGVVGIPSFLLLVAPLPTPLIPVRCRAATFCAAAAAVVVVVVVAPRIPARREVIDEPIDEEGCCCCWDIDASLRRALMGVVLFDELA